MGGGGGRGGGREEVSFAPLVHAPSFTPRSEAAPNARTAERRGAQAAGKAKPGRAAAHSVPAPTPGGGGNVTANHKPAAVAGIVPAPLPGNRSARAGGMQQQQEEGSTAPPPPAQPKPAYRCPQCWVFFERWPECMAHLSKTRHSGSEMLRGSRGEASPDQIRLLMRRCLARAICADCSKDSSDGWTATAEHGQPFYCAACWSKYELAK